MGESGAAAFHDLLERLGVQAGDLVYLHTSFSRLRHLDLSPDALLRTLLNHLGRAGTLVLPSFAWHLDPAQRPWSGYARYYAARPVFDVRSTPANIGIVPEVFRSFPGVRRSIHYWWSVAAHGPLAEEITRDQDAVLHPYGPDSAFGRMHRHGVTMLGLGVSLNTTSLAPVVDHELGASRTQALFSERPEDGVVVDFNGRRLVTRSYWLLPEVVRLIKPSHVIEATSGLRGQMRRADHGGSFQFAYRFDDYFTPALAMGQEAGAAGHPMPWLRDYPLRVDAG